MSTITRVPCPLDPHHSVAQETLASHLTRCPARQVEAGAVWFQENVNGTAIAQNTPTTTTHKDKNNLETHGLAWVEQVAAVAASVAETFSVMKIVQNHPVMDARLQQLTNVKHAQQQASLIGHLSSMGLLDEIDLYIEWGAGRAELSFYVSQALLETTRSAMPKFLVIDRGSGRPKYDGRISQTYAARGLQTGEWFRRHKVDIAHVKLDRLLSEDFPDLLCPAICSVSKHLCGAATDLTLNCLLSSRSWRAKKSGIVIALCCHHLSTWDALLPGSQKFLVNAGIKTFEAFDVLRQMTSWHTSSVKSGTDTRDGTCHWTGLSHDERDRIGGDCKRILDASRVAALHAEGWNAKIIQYQSAAVTTECYALMATWPGKDS